MSFPTIPTGARIISALQANTTATRTFPNLDGLTNSAGDLLIAICFAYQTGTGTDAAFSGWTGSFTEFGDRATTTTMAIGMAYKWSTGSETGTFAVTQAGTITGHAAMIVMAIPGAHASTIPEAGTKVNGTSGAADIASLNPAGWDVEDTLWIVVGGSGEVATTSTYFGMSNSALHTTPWTTVTLPADYSNGYATGVTQDAAGGVEGAVGFRQLAAASADPAAFAPDLSNARNSSLLIAVRPIPTTDLVIADAAHAHAADAIALTQAHTLAIADGAHGHTVDNAVLTQVHILTVADAAHAQTADNVVLEEQAGSTNLVIADAAHGHVADNVALTQVHALTVADAAQAQMADNLVLTQVHLLTVADAGQAHSADNVALTQVHALIIQDAAHAQTADECQIDSATQLVIANATHAHSADGLALTQVHQLLVADAVQSHMAELIALTQGHVLTVADASQTHTADNVILTIPSAMGLGSIHGSSSSSPGSASPSATVGIAGGIS